MCIRDSPNIEKMLSDYDHESLEDFGKAVPFGSYFELEIPEVQKAIKDMGHDSFYVNEGTDNLAKNLGIFDPRKIKSAIGNRGTYDTTDPDITKAKGGIVSMLRKHGRPVDNDLDAMRKMSNGHRVFIAHEQDEMPTEIHRVADMHGYTPDQIYTIAPEHFIQHKDLGGIIKAVKGFATPNNISRVTDVPYLNDAIQAASNGKWGDLIGSAVNATLPLGAGLMSYSPDAGEANEADQVAAKYTPDARARAATQYLQADNFANKARGGITHKANGGTMDQPSLAQMRVNLAQNRNPDLMDSIGVNEAVDMQPKMFINPNPKPIGGIPSIGGVSTKNGMPIGGVDVNPQQPGQQLNPQPPQMPGQPQPGQPGASGAAPAPGGAPTGPSGGAPAQMGNMLQMTPQGQALAAMGGGTTQQPQQLANGGMANGGQKPKKLTVEEMKRAIFEKAQKGLQKASEVLGKHEGSNIFLTEADRAKVEKKKNGMRGGVGFSQIGLEDPDYAGRTWGVGKSGTAIKLLNRQNKRAPEGNAIWTTFIGTPEMHTSNQIVFDRMYKNFLQAKKAGLLSPEKEAEMLDIMRSAMTRGTEKKPSQAIFKPNANFDDNDLFNTFEKRRILSDLMSGKKIGGKKAQIFDASKMIEDTTDPKLLHAPTLSVGPHVFTFNGETSHEPHLNQAFPFMLHGETSPDAFQQVPFKTFAEDFTNQIKQTKGRDPGYMDIVRNIPSQFLSEKYLTNLQKQGYEEGGNVKLHEDIEMASGGAMRLELLKKKARDAFPHMNDGGQPPKRRVFNIMPATQGAVKTPNGFTPYDASNPTIASLARAFDEAIAHHLALPSHNRMMNSVRAAEMVSNHVGRTGDNKPKDLLGKNAKLIKSEKGGEEAIKLPDNRGVETTGLALAPAFVQGKFNTCPNSASCKAECLGKTSGNYFKLGGGTNLEEFKGPRLNSLNKTLAMINDPHSFAVKLYDEIQDAKAIAAQNNNHLGVRLNVLSDLNPRVHKAIINGHPDVTFYDYTKNNTNPIAPNHHYTYSSTGVSDQDIHNPNSNWKQMRRRLEGGDNVAMAFTHNEHLPHQIVDHETGKVFKVINGDSHDFRPLDIQPEGEHGVIVGLKNKKAIGEKGNAHIDSNGFFVKYDPQLMKKENGRYSRVPTTEISAKTGKPKLGETIPQNRTVHIHPQSPAPREKSNDEGWEV